MTNVRKGILFVCGHDGQLLGVVSDGDLRRAILHDSVLSTPVSSVLNPDPITASTEEEARTLANQHSAVAVPILDRIGVPIAMVLDDGAGGLVTLHRAALEGHSSVTTGALAIVPARGGSTRLPRKNMARLAGRSLVSWAVGAATASSYVGRTLVSTDDAEIADEARRAGGEVPWLRPAHLAGAETSTLDVLIHACEWALGPDQEDPPDVAVLLEPTSPLRPVGLVDEAIRLLRSDPDASSVVTVAAVPHVLNPLEQVTVEEGFLSAWAGGPLDDRNRMSRDRPSLVCTGQVYAFRPTLLLQTRTLFGPRCRPFLRPWHEFIDIDFEHDLHHAELILAQHGIR
jgi:CMP-N-acetylneuraminic acid synthetase